MSQEEIWEKYRVTWAYWMCVRLPHYNYYIQCLNVPIDSLISARTCLPFQAEWIDANGIEEIVNGLALRSGELKIYVASHKPLWRPMRKYLTLVWTLPELNLWTTSFCRMTVSDFLSFRSTFLHTPTIRSATSQLSTTFQSPSTTNWKKEGF